MRNFHFLLCKNKFPALQLPDNINITAVISLLIIFTGPPQLSCGLIGNFINVVTDKTNLISTVSLLSYNNKEFEKTILRLNFLKQSFGF